MIQLFDREEIARMATRLLEMGYSPSIVRRRLAARGIRWEYQFAAGRRGVRERLRRLRQQGLGLCATCHADSYHLDSVVNMCQSCLDRKWATAARLGPSALG